MTTSTLPSTAGQPAVAVPEPLLQVRDLHVALDMGGTAAAVLHGVHLDVRAGEIVGLVGESGSGKTTTALAVLRLLPRRFRVTRGSISFAGNDLLTMPESALGRLRGGRLATIFQDPIRHLNPVFTIGDQIGMLLRTHNRGLSGREARARAGALLAQVQIVDPERCLRAFPHQLSGGMAQRVMIAMALTGEPDLLLADEPTAALDVTVQAEVLRLLRGIARERRMAVLFISHNLGAVWQLCDRVAVMYAGHVVESAPSADLFGRPDHPYTRALLGAVPRLGNERSALASIAGAPPTLAAMPSGCPFHPRCRHARAECTTVLPALVATPGPDHQARCLFAGQLPN